MDGRLCVLIAAPFLLAGCRAPAEKSGPPPAPSGAASAPIDAALPPSAEAGPTTAPAGAALPNVATDWCSEPWRGLDESHCFWLPDDGVEAGTPARLLVYLPGIIPPTPTSPPKERVQRIVIAASRRAGVVALLPRGRRGVGPTNQKDWWAWPTSPSDVAKYGAAMVADWLDARSRLEAILGRPFARTYLAGSSSGAYFLSALALGGAIDVDGFAAASGGAPSFVMPVKDAGPLRKRPFYVGYSNGDPTSDGPKALAEHLRQNGWPTRSAEHPGGHGAREIYLDDAFAFWSACEADAGGPK